MDASLNCIPVPEKILPVKVRDEYVLITILEPVQSAVGVFLQHGEARDVELIAVGVKRPEYPQTRLLVGKNEPPKIAVETLNSGARGNEIVIGTQVFEFDFDETFLHAEVRVEARGSGGRIGIHDPQFARCEIIHVLFRGDSDAPVRRTKGCVSMKELCRKREVLKLRNNWPNFPKKAELPGRSEGTLLGVGNCRPSTKVVLTKFKIRKVLFPKTG